MKNTKPKTLRNLEGDRLVYGSWRQRPLAVFWYMFAAQAIIFVFCLVALGAIGLLVRLRGMLFM